MATKKRLLAAGGDLRQLTAAARLAADYSVTVTGFDRFGSLPPEVTAAEHLQNLPEQLDALLLPMPVTQDGVFLHTPFSSNTVALSSLLPLVKTGGTVFGGRMTPAEQTMITAAGLCPKDYAKAETFAVRNAVPTAEGAIQIAMQELPVVLLNLPCLILGAGRVSRALQPRLRALGARVTVAARRCEALAWCEGIGCRGIPFAALDDVLPEAALIINTVPAKVLDRERLSLLRKNVLVLDLASKPGGSGVGDNQGRLVCCEAALRALPSDSRPRDIAPWESRYKNPHLPNKGDADFSYAESREIISLWQGCGDSVPTITYRIPAALDCLRSGLFADLDVCFAELLLCNL